MIRSTLSVLALACLTTAASAQKLTIPSDGSDGVFNPTSNIQIDLSLAPTAHWSTPGTGNGVYDPDQWAVVFKFASVNIPSGVTVTFKNHPSYAPVMWLVEGDVVINGTVSLNGVSGVTGGTAFNAQPGPGGFRGGRFTTSGVFPSGGFGPGGGGVRTSSLGSGGGAGHAVAGGNGQGEAMGGVSYGNQGLFPLIGGSGGGGAYGEIGGNGSGGAGGGAFLLASSQSISINGLITARGGNGGGIGGGSTNRRGGGAGSGGAIRIICEVVSGSGTLNAIGGGGGFANAGTGGNGSDGQIRIEAFENSLVDLGSPAYSFGVPAMEPRIFRDSETPSVRAVTLAGQEVPLDPESRLAFPTMDVQLDEGGEQTLLIQAENMPPSGTMVVRLVRRTGAVIIVPATFVSGDPFLSTWQAEVDLPQGFSAIQIRAVLPEP